MGQSRAIIELKVIQRSLSLQSYSILWVFLARELVESRERGKEKARGTKCGRDAKRENTNVKDWLSVYYEGLIKLKSMC